MDKMICEYCGANQIDYGGISITPKGIECAKCHKYDHFKIVRERLTEIDSMLNQINNAS